MQKEPTARPLCGALKVMVLRRSLKVILKVSFRINRARV